MRRRRWRPGRGGLSRVKLWGGLAVVVLAALAVWMDISIRPLVRSYGLNHAKTVCSRAINESVTDLLTQENLQYADLVEVEKKETGEILSVEANALSINRLKADITNTVLDRLEKEDVQTLKIPIGTLTGSDFLTGRGPNICIKISITATALTNIRSEFSSAGINQTCHQLFVDLQVELFAALPGNPEEITVDSEFLVAETILAGTVPEFFADLQKAGT